MRVSAKGSKATKAAQLRLKAGAEKVARDWREWLRVQEQTRETGGSYGSENRQTVHACAVWSASGASSR